MSLPGTASDSDEQYPHDFTVAAPGQKHGWLLKKTKSIGHNRYSPIWVELDELNQLVSCFSRESHLGALKSEKLLSFELEKAKITSGISKRGKFLVTIVDKNRKKYVFAAKTAAEQKSWVDSLNTTLQSKNTKSSVLKRWIDDKETLDQIEFTADIFRGLDDSRNDSPEASQYSSNVTTANDMSESDQECEEDYISADTEKDLKRALYSMFLLDVDGNLTLFGDIVHGQTTLLFFLRHFGCIMWRAAIEEVIEKRELLDKCGIRVAAIGNGTPEMAREFLNDYPKFPGRLFVDPDKKVHNAMHCKFGVKCALSAEVLQSVRDACKRGYKQKGIQGDPLQLGGTFIISPTQGMIYRRLENYIGSTTDLPSLIPFVTEYSKNHPQTTWQFNEVDQVSPQSPDYTLNFYQENFALQQHTIYVYPRSENAASSLILAVVDLKQGDYKCIAFHAKGKTKLYWPFYLSREEMFKQLTQRIYGTHVNDPEFIKLNRNPMIADQLYKLEETINSCLSTSDASNRLSSALEETANLLVKHSIDIGVGSSMVASGSSHNLTRAS